MSSTPRSPSRSPAEEERRAKRQRILETISDCLGAEDAASLPAEVLSDAFLYLDVEDVPSTAGACKEWNSTLDAVEDELWLGLVRKHCPIVEEITNLLPENIDAKDEGGAGESTLVVAKNSGDDDSETTVRIPAPSRNWKRQFQRHHLLDKTSAPTLEKPPPKPLSSYFFKIDLILYKKVKDQAGKGEKIGIVSRIFKDAKFGGGSSRTKTLEIEMNGLKEEMDQFDFSTFDFAITVFDRASGKQATLFDARENDVVCCHANLWYIGSSVIADAYAFDAPGLDDGCITCDVLVAKTGCTPCGPTDLFSKSEDLCGCCECDEDWGCIWDMDVSCRIEACFDLDTVDLDEKEQLRVLEGLLFK